MNTIKISAFVILSLLFYSVNAQKGSVYIFTQKGKKGLINENQEVVLAPKYENLSIIKLPAPTN